MCLKISILHVLNRSARPEFLCGKSGENLHSFYRYYIYCTKHNHANQDLFSSVRAGTYIRPWLELINQRKISPKNPEFEPE